MMQDNAYAYGGPLSQGRIKVRPEDFQVTENLPFTPSGEGEHAYLYIKKQDINTTALQKALARYANLPYRDVSFAGMKDKQAITKQWFSVHLPGKVVDWDDFQLEGVSIMEATRHDKKLKRGVLQANDFRIAIRDFEANAETIAARMSELAQGFPNYFGVQRFGYQGANLEKATAWLEKNFKVKREQKSLYLSALRAALFNTLLSTRVAEQTWCELQPGDVLQLEGSQSIFTCAALSDDLLNRLAQRELHLTGPLWGVGAALSGGDVFNKEQVLLTMHPLWCAGLERHGLKQERRALRALPQNLTWEYNEEEKCLVLAFSLPKGCYATSLLREVVDFEAGA